MGIDKPKQAFKYMLVFGRMSVVTFQIYFILNNKKKIGATAPTTM